MWSAVLGVISEEELWDNLQYFLERVVSVAEEAYEGVLRPDHYPLMGDDTYDDEFRSARVFAVGYVKGLREAVYAGD